MFSLMHAPHPAPRQVTESPAPADEWTADEANWARWMNGRQLLGESFILTNPYGYGSILGQRKGYSRYPKIAGWLFSKMW